VIRTHIIPCELPREQADALNRQSGAIYTGVLVAHWRVMRNKGLWLSEKSGTRWSDHRTDVKMHAHSIDAAQQGFYQACSTTRALRKAGFTEAQFAHWRKTFRTTVWKNTGIRRRDDCLELSQGRSSPKLTLMIPAPLRHALGFLEVRLVYDQKAHRYTWHLVIENGKEPKPAPDNNVVAVDLGEIHPGVIGDAFEATMISCRERRGQSQGHAKRLAQVQRARSRKTSGRLISPCLEAGALRRHLVTSPGSSSS
jgi:hypothetical protein